MRGKWKGAGRKDEAPNFKRRRIFEEGRNTWWGEGCAPRADGDAAEGKENDGENEDRERGGRRRGGMPKDQ